MNEDQNNNILLTFGTPGSAGGIPLNSDQHDIMAIGSGLVDSAVRSPELNNMASSISPHVNIDTNPNINSDVNIDININSHAKAMDSNNITSEISIQTTATHSDKHRNPDSNSNINNNILNDADNAAIAAQTIALVPGTMTETVNAVNGENTINITNVQNSNMNPTAAAAAATASNDAADNSNSNTSQNITGNGMHEILLGSKKSNNVYNNPVNMNSMNLNQYVLASAGVPPTSLPINTTVSTPATSYNYVNTNVINPTTSLTSEPNNSNGNANAAINSNQHYQSAILQQNAAIMQQNAATLQHLQNLQQTNKLLAANPEAAATLGMLAPIMNMNLTTANPVQLLATAAPSLNFKSAGGASNATASTFLPVTTSLQAPNLSEINGASTFTTAQVGTQQQQGMPIPAQLGTIAIAPGGSQIFPVTGFANNIDVNNSNIANSNNGIVDGSSNNNNNNGAVQNILRTAYMLQNSGLPFLQQGMIHQQQQLIPSPAGGGIMLVPNSSNNSNPFAIVPTGLSTHNNNFNDTIDNSNGNNQSNSKTNGNGTNDVGNNGQPTSAVAAAANAAASVLPPASMNLPLQQHLQQQQLNHSLTPQMGIDLNNSSNNNAIALLGGGALNDSINNNNLQIAGLATLQQQQRNQAMAFSQMNLPGPHPQVSLPLAAPQQQKQQQLSLGSTLNPANTQLKQQQQPQTQKKKPSISRPLYLDHDSNCLTAYQCFLRKQIELFEVGHDEMNGTAQGRNTPLHYGQVGIRCRHCSHLPKAARARGGVYYSRTIDGVYQVAQNMSKLHFLKACTLIPDNTKNQLKSLQSVSSRASGGKEYWAEGLRVLGIVEEGGMLRFASNRTASSSTQSSKSAS